MNILFDQDVLIQISALCFVAVLLSWPLGRYIAKVALGQDLLLTPLFGPVERIVYRIFGLRLTRERSGETGYYGREMSWAEYACCLLLLGLTCFLILFLLLLCQDRLPFVSDAVEHIPAQAALHITVSLITGTGLYTGLEGPVLIPFVQMMGVIVQAFFSAATGLAVFFVLARAFMRLPGAKVIGNFWVDMTRIILYLLLPLSLVFAVLFSGQGLVQNLTYTSKIATVESQGPNVGHEQTLYLGPVASQKAISQLGGSGANYYPGVQAHPYESPTPMANWLHMLAALLIPVALCTGFGLIIGDIRQGHMLLIVMAVLIIPMIATTLIMEGRASASGIDATTVISNGDMTGREVRFGVASTALGASIAVATNGVGQAAFDSFSPLSSAGFLLTMLSGGAVFGKPGTGMQHMLVYALIAAFIAGQMIGRTPVFLGRSIRIGEIRLISLYLLLPMVLLVGASLFMLFQAEIRDAIAQGQNGYQQFFYAIASAMNNNGSSSALQGPLPPFYYQMLNIIMLLGYYGSQILILALAGSLVSQQSSVPQPTDLATATPLFCGFLVSVIVILTLLVSAPGLALGPVADQFRVIAGG